MDRINPRNLFVKKNELLSAIMKKPDLYVAFWTMFVCIIVHGWITALKDDRVHVFFNYCFRFAFSYILTLLVSASVLWIGTMYVADSLSVVISISYSGYLLLLYEVVRLVSVIVFILSNFDPTFFGFVLTSAALLYVNFLNIFYFYSEKNKTIAAILCVAHSFVIPVCMLLARS